MNQPDYLIKPWKHQLQAIDRAKSSNYFGLWFEQGCGKTSTTINILRHKFSDEKNPFRTLIVCPAIVIDNWVSEFLVHSHVPKEKLITLTGPAFFRLHRTDTPRDAIYITNYQSVLMQSVFNRLLSMNFTAIVLDESHTIKTHNSKTTKRVLELGKKAIYRFCLSGTPILNTVSDIYPQVNFMDQGQLFGNDFFKFRSKYFKDFNSSMPRYVYFPNWKMRPDAPEKIKNLIEPISMRVLKKDCLDLPPLVRQTVNCQLTDEQADVYRSLEKTFVANLQNGQVMTELELTKGLRLQEIVSGYCPNDMGEIHDFEPNSRIDAVRELLEGISKNHKVIIWANFRRNISKLESLCASMCISFVSVYGAVTGDEQRRHIKDFEADDKIRVLIGHPKSCGVGANLTSASYSIFFSRGFSLQDDLQAEARNYRGGSERHQSITRIDLVTPATIDQAILEALEKKQNLSEAVLNHIKKQKEDICYRISNPIKI